MNSHITLNTQYWVSLYFQGEDPTWINFTFRHAVLCDVAADHYLGFLKVNFQTIALKSLISLKKLFLSLNCVTHQYTATHLTHPMAKQVITSTTTAASMQHHGVHQIGCMDNDLEPSCDILCQCLPRKVTNSGSTLPRVMHLAGGVIGCEQCLHLTLGKYSGISPNTWPTPQALSSIHTNHHLHTYPHTTHHSHD